MNDEKEQYLTPAEVRKRYRFGRDYLRRLIRNKEIRYIELSPRKILFDRADVETFMRGKTVPATRRFFNHRTR